MTLRAPADEPTPLAEAEIEVRALTKVIRSTLARVTVREDNPSDTSRLIALAVSDYLAARTSTTDDGLRKRVEALLTGGDIPWAIAADLRAVLDATAALTTDKPKPGRDAMSDLRRRIERIQRDRREALALYAPLRNVALESHLDQIDAALAAPTADTGARDE
jgi:hypothetical protein